MNKRKKILLYSFLIVFYICLLGIVCFLMLRPPLISVVMPTYNRIDLLPRAIESILNQTVSDFEFIIVDDGSTDNSVQLIQAYQSSDSRIRLIQNKQNCGIACARNIGMDAARGKYLAIMDSDDYSEPNRLEKSLAFFKKHPDYTAVNSIYYEMGREAKGPNNWVPPKRWEIIFNFANYYTNLAMFDLEFARKHQLRYDESLISAEDYDFWSRMWLAGGKLGMINEPLLRLRRHSSYGREYYDTILSMRKVISAKLLARFGISKEDAYEADRCKLMKQMIDANIKKQIVNQYALVFTYEQECTRPVLPEGTLYIKHFDFVDYFFPLSGSLYMRAETKEKYEKIRESGNDIILKNPAGEEELYRRQSGNIFALVEDLE